MNPKSTREQAIQVLSEEWPLTAKEVHKRLGKEFYNEISYQAVHKLLSEMQEQGLIKNENKKVELNKEWLKAQKQFFEETEAKYTGKNNKYIIDQNERGPQTFEFDDYSTFCITMAEMINNQLQLEGMDKTGAGLLRHLWFPTSFKFVDFDLLKKMAKYGKTHLAVKSDSPFDNWLAKQYGQANLGPIKLGAKELDVEDDFAVRGDYFFQIHFSEETKQIMDEYYSRVNNITDLLKEYIQQKITKKKMKITLTITRNKDMVEIIKKKAKQLTEEGKTK